jgi:hypothetical protein
VLRRALQNWPGHRDPEASRRALHDESTGSLAGQWIHIGVHTGLPWSFVAGRMSIEWNWEYGCWNMSYEGWTPADADMLSL